MKNEITRIVVTNIGKGQLLGEQTVENDAAKTTNLNWPIEGRKMFQLVEKKHFPTESCDTLGTFETFEKAMACLKDLCNHDFVGVLADYAITFEGKELFSTDNENAR